MSKTINIGIDNGNGNTKGANVCIGAGVKRLSGDPHIKKNILEINGDFYEVGKEKMTIHADKTENNDMKYSVISAAAKEMMLKNINSANVRLAIGTPLTRVGAEKKQLEKYMLGNPTYNFRLDGKQFVIHLISVDVFPQGYSAVVDKLDTFGASAVIVDIGSWTIDIMPINDGQPDVSGCKSLELGTITVMNEINEQLRQRFNGEISPVLLKQIMIEGKVEIKREYLDVIRKCLKNYVVEIMDNLRSLKINPEVTNIVFIGGGAVIIKNFADEMTSNISVIEDVHINAKGYEKILAHKYKGEFENDV